MGPIILFWIIGLIVLFMVIKWAIDSSETAENIRQIRKVLSKNFPMVEDHEEAEEKELEESDEKLDELPLDECPACHSKILESDMYCHNCGLKFRNDDLLL